MKNEHSAEQLAPIRLMLVEDHLLTRMDLKAILARTSDIKVIGEADNGEEAVKLALKLKPNIILMDVGMPVMDGIAATRKIAVDAPDINVIMLTSHDNDDEIFASLAAGAAGYCLKDIAPERLYAAIRWVNAGDVWLDCAIADKVFKKYMSAPTKLNLQQLAQTATESKPKSSEPLSPVEMEVLILVVEGLSNKEIADRLMMPLATAQNHIRSILGKLAVDDRTLKAMIAIHNRNRTQLL